MIINHKFMTRPDGKGSSPASGDQWLVPGSGHDQATASGPTLLTALKHGDCAFAALLAGLLSATHCLRTLSGCDSIAGQRDTADNRRSTLGHRFSQVRAARGRWNAATAVRFRGMITPGQRPWSDRGACMPAEMTNSQVDQLGRTETRFFQPPTGPFSTRLRHPVPIAPTDFSTPSEVDQLGRTGAGPDQPNFDTWGTFTGF